MTKHLTLLLFIGLAWAKSDLDKLVLKNGIEYLGKFEKEENGFIYFKPEREFGYKPIEINKVDTLLTSYELSHNEEKLKENENTYRKHNISVGLFNEFTGLSIVGYNHSY